MATRVADGWWVLGIEGHLDHMTSNSEEVRVGEGMELGDLLVRLGPNSMVTCRRDGLDPKMGCSSSCRTTTPTSTERSC